MIQKPQPIAPPEPAPVPAPGYPTDAIIALTYRCDARCEMCNIWQLKPQEFLSIDDYAKVRRRSGHQRFRRQAFMRSDVADREGRPREMRQPRIVISIHLHRSDRPR
jgi:hypothetical protein